MSIPALLLRLLLALALVVNGTTGAMAAVHAHDAAAPMAVHAMGPMPAHGEADCHGDGAVAKAPSKAPAQAPGDDCAGCASGGCDCACMSLVHVTLPAPMTGLAPAPRIAPAPVPVASRAAPPLPHPIRPPIGQG